jgi:hypothetical protein
MGALLCNVRNQVKLDDPKRPENNGRKLVEDLATTEEYREVQKGRKENSRKHLIKREPGPTCGSNNYVPK